MQGIWLASVSELQSDPVVKPLYTDAGSGILFNLAGDVKIGHEALPQGVIMLPVKKVSENIVLSPGSKIAGIRFHPAIGYGVLGQHFDKPTCLSPAEDEQYHLYQIYAELRMQKDNTGQIDALYRWTENNLSFTNVIPVSLERALKGIEIGEAPGQLNENIQLSQRQIERLFQFWLGMTPKHYQRILRVKKAVSFLRQHKNENLADVAQQFGFSDQAHMTREFRVIACITPGKI
ncbi:helix-turn-helix domain-containing protein [Photobacterium sp. MCCC 1A19761]|uniref:helix-turn-helix domain-containing protein n=1 Tax=Photobacterium sp. MCCC 1A19761 TaxID=3115000 RepID=UPI00307EFA88